MPLFVAQEPTLAPLWDASKNGESSTKVPAHSYHAAWWICANGHSFQRAPRQMLRDSSCKICKLGGTAAASIAKKRPHIVALWHPTRNGALTPNNLPANSTVAVWWQCPKKHEFRRAPLEMDTDSSCPQCVLLETTSLAVVNPNIAKEWSDRNAPLKPTEVDANHVMNVWWRCPNGHDYQATVRARVKGGRRCPKCYGGWSISAIRDFVKDLLKHPITAFNESERYAFAMQAGALKDPRARDFVIELVKTDRFPPEELQKFANGEPSTVDAFVKEKETFKLENPDGRPPSTPPQSKRYDLPASPAHTNDSNVEIDLTRAVNTDKLEREGEADEELPVVQTRDALAALDSVLVASADAETVQFLIASAKAKLWRHAYVDPTGARAQAASFQGDLFSSHVRDEFLLEFDEARELAHNLPTGYQFRPKRGAAIAPPNLMQCRVAVCVRDRKRFGNWSGMGAGKTLSAILATRVVDAQLTVITCPNSVVETWVTQIKNAFPDSDIQQKTWHPKWSENERPCFLVMNYEQFQQRNSEADLVAFTAEHTVDFIVIDEIHFTKHRDPGMAISKRKHLVQGLVLEAGKKNVDLHVLGMSGTPVINTLQEGKSLIEIINGHKHDDIEVKVTVQNCMRLYQQLVTLGTRWKPDYAMQLNEERKLIDVSADLDEIRKSGDSLIGLEQVLTRLRIPTIVGNIKPHEKVIIYTQYIDGIEDELFRACKDAGLRVGLFTGNSGDDAIGEFVKPHGKVDVLIASSRISTGVDGLQDVCSKLIINVLPWTRAEYDQLVARVWRQGQRKDRVDVIIPVTFAMVRGKRWSYCESKLHRLAYKKSIADAAVDGVVPQGNLRSSAQAQQDIMGWLTRLETGELQELRRPVIVIPLSGTPVELANRVRKYGDFSRMNSRWYAGKSSTTHEALVKNPEEWGHYHTEYRRLREAWPVVPFEEEIRWLQRPGRDGMTIGDFGCGEALIAAAVRERHYVYSFDHIAINDDVIACDMARTPLEAESLDVAIFCLSLMGSNFMDYLREAHRCLRIDGFIHVWEPANHFPDLKAFAGGLGRLGFDVIGEPISEGRFVKIYATKNAETPDASITLPFRGSAS
jgi:hypothetical protein